MVKLILFFKRPPEVEFESFENMFSQRYVPAINRLPQLKRASVARSIGAPRGEPVYYLVHELYFDTYEQLIAALNSAPGRAAGQELMSFARDLVTMMYAEAWEDDMRPHSIAPPVLVNEPPAPDAHLAPEPDASPAAVQDGGPFAAQAAAGAAEAVEVPAQPMPSAPVDQDAAAPPAEPAASPPAG